MLLQKVIKSNSDEGKKYSIRQSSTSENLPLTYEIPRMPREKEIIENVIILCIFCNGPCIDDSIHCGVCMKTYHYQCRYELDNVNDQSSLLPSLQKQYNSCLECEDLTQLLTEDEINYLISIFKHIDQDKDGFIILRDFLAFCTNGILLDKFHLFTLNNIDLNKVHFNIMDSRQNRNVAWVDFERFYICKLIAAKNKIELTTKLSENELRVAKRLYMTEPHLKIDKKRNLIITKRHLSQISHNLIVTNKEKYGGNFIDAILHENENIDEIFEKRSVITWDKFLCEICILIILNRSNYEINSQETTIHSSYINLQYDTTNKHKRILEKLKQKHFDSSSTWSIVENEDAYDLLKLKIDGRDERQTISEPWSIVKEMEQLRNKPIFITTTTQIL
ncbi:unnamed protein product [Adineta steineri]|uniref:EF-hand domain-containing protein n=1 Tax=Adineta steineri TaxID=433720 RepID=A0A814VNP1_9BILA|nr:unnamed protein product [Adineta steineri]